MITHREIRTAPNLLFEVSTAGIAGAPLVLLLHGFAVSHNVCQPAAQAKWMKPLDTLAPDGAPRLVLTSALRDLRLRVPMRNPEPGL